MSYYAWEEEYNKTANKAPIEVSRSADKTVKDFSKAVNASPAVEDVKSHFLITNKESDFDLNGNEEIRRAILAI